jgi:monofunctional biosynthetic peptidoglycan transglycosylase
VRKGLEFPLALWIDLVLPKRRVLEIYLNIAEWGPNGQYGAEAGSRYAFNKTAHALERARGRAAGRGLAESAPAAAPSSRDRPCAGSPAFTKRAARPRPRLAYCAKTAGASRQ